MAAPEIELGNVHSVVRSDSWSHMREMCAEFTVAVKGAEYMSSVQAGRWDGKIRFLHQDGQVLTGLLPRLVSRWKTRYGETPRILDRRPRPAKTWPDLSLEGFALRADQEDVVERCMREERGLVEYPTGTGKGLMLVELARRIGVPTLVVVFSKALLYQTRDNFARYLGIDPSAIGMIGDGIADPRDAFVTVAVVNSLHMALRSPDMKRFLATVGCVIVDEVHHFHKSLSKFKAVMTAITGARWRYGMSAMPYNDFRAPKAAYSDSDVCTLDGLFGPPVVSRTLASAAGDGLVVPPRVYMLLHEIPATDFESWSAEYYHLIVHSEPRNALLADAVCALLDCGFTGIMVMLEQVEHTKVLGQVLDEKKVDHTVVTGTLATPERMRRTERFRSGACRVLITNRAMREGVDIPRIDAVVLGGGLKAPQLLLQSIGRGVRTAEGKLPWIPVVDVYDAAGCGRHTRAHAKERMDFYRAEKFVVSSLADVSLLSETLDEVRETGVHQD